MRGGLCTVAQSMPMTWAAMASRNASGPSAAVTSTNTNSAGRQQTVPDTNQPAKTAW